MKKVEIRKTHDKKNIGIKKIRKLQELKIEDLESFVVWMAGIHNIEITITFKVNIFNTLITISQ